MMLQTYPHRARTDFNSKILFIGFILAPILTVPQLIKDSMRNKVSAQILLCIFLGLLSVLTWPPRADTYRHAMLFYKIQGLGFDEIMRYYFRGDIVLLGGSYLFGKLGFSFEFLRLIFMAVAYGLTMHLYNLMCQHDTVPEKRKSILFWICILIVPFYDIVYAIRYGFAMMFVCTFILKRYFIGDKSWTDYLYLLIGFFIHFGTAWLIGIALFAPVIPNRLSKAVFIALFFIALVISANTINIIQLLASHLYSDQMIALYTEQLTQRFIFHNFIGTLMEYMRNLPLYLTIALCIFTIPYSKSTKILMVTILVWAATFELWEINRRIALPITILGPIITCMDFRFRKLILSTLVLCAMAPAIIPWRSYTVSNIGYLLAPLPISICQSYDYNWLKTHVASDGTMRVYIR